MMLRFKDPEATLTDEEKAALLEEGGEFDSWLKRDKKISHYPNASRDRERRREKLAEIMKQSPKPVSLKRIVEGIQVALQTDTLTDKEILQDIAEFFSGWVGIQIGSSTIDRVPEPESEVQPVEFEVIGRVAPTLRTPSTPTEFCFWVKDDENIHVEAGSIVTARHPLGIRVTGLVSDIQASSDVEGVLDSFYSHAFGTPTVEMPTKLPIVLNAKVEVVRRSDGKTEPVRGTWPVSFASAKEIREAYGAEISPEHEILAGFTYDGQHNSVPIGIDARYVIGYEAAHVNISGASGVATKTSYALFLLYSLLAYHQQHQGSVAAIAFNVKEADLMFIDKLPTWEKLESFKDHAKLGPSIRLWFQMRDDYMIDPIQWKESGKLQFFAPQHFQPKARVLSQRRDELVTPFNYSLPTLIDSGVGSIYTLFNPEDLDEKALAFIASLSEEARANGWTFEDLVSNIRKAFSAAKGGEWFTMGSSSHHKATANKILNRLNHALDSQLRGVVLKSEKTDQPIPIKNLRPGELWVIDITQLSDKGQRLIFQTVVRSVFQILEQRKSLELTGQLSDELKSFPKHVVIFVDELNKFVPSGREYSALKSDIVEMAARGRSIGMALCGAQQLASKVDEEVLANTSTFVVGRSHAVEIRKPPYAWLPEGLKERAMVLDKGWMLLWHCLHKRPVLIHFPLPLHRIQEEIEMGASR
jgi:hypothetical protein